MRICSLVLLTLFIFSADAIELPNGWCFPTEKELLSQPMRNESPNKNAVVDSDFNGDGKTDHAYLLKSTVYSSEGLLVQLSTPDGYTWKVLDKIAWGKEYSNVDLAMGIDLVKPGDYKTACSKGYWECKENEPETLMLKTPGILYFRFESAASIYYWDKKSEEFKQVWISD